MGEGDSEDVVARPSNGCPGCACALTKVLILPGGREVDANTVPFSEAVRGVQAVEECRACGVRLDG